jgi:hypothetical protein
MAAESLARVAVRVRAIYPQAAALRMAEIEHGAGWELVAVVDPAGAALPLGSRDAGDEDTPAWSPVAVDHLADLIEDDLCVLEWYGGWPGRLVALPPAGGGR